MSPGRKLRAVQRPVPVARLFTEGEVPFDGGPLLKVGGGTDDRPLVLVRAGGQDVEAVRRGIAQGAQPSGVTVGLGELKTTVRGVRGIANDHGVPWGSDPLLYKTTFTGYRTSQSLQQWDYTPGRDADPYTAEELADPTALRQITRKSIGHQYDMGAGFVVGADFYVSSVSDPMFGICRRAIGLSIDARDAYGPRPLIAPVRIDLNGFERPEDQALLVRALAARRPDAYLLHLNGLHEDATAKRIFAALRLMLALETVGAPVIFARPGDLRHAALAAGVRGVEVGLGRLLRFSAPDYNKASRGPGPVPPRFEFPTLVASLPGSSCQVALEAGRLEECACPCPSCSGKSVAERVAGAPVHNLHKIIEGVTGLAGLTAIERCTQLDAALARASWLLNGLKHPHAKVVQRRGGKMRSAIDELGEQGLLVPDAAAEALGLTG